MNWDEIVQNYIVKHADAIKATTKPLSDHFGISYFTYHRIDEAGKYTVLINRPEWAECYVGRKFYELDPFLSHPDCFQPGTSYVEALMPEDFFSEVVEAAVDVLEIDSQIQIIQKQANAVEIFGFGGKSHDRNFQEIYLNHTTLLQRFGEHFKKSHASLLTQMEDEAASLHTLKGSEYLTTHPLHGHLDVAQFLNDMGLQEQVRLAKLLTAREKECLRLFLEGKSAKETAQLLQRSSRTIETHFEHMKAKFGCWSKNELFQIAKELDRLRLLP